jgi:hypothetical protein
MLTFFFTFRSYQKHETISMLPYFVKVIAESEKVAKDVIRIIYRGYAECEISQPNDKILFEIIKQRFTKI